MWQNGYSSILGSSHQKSGTECQDFVVIRESEKKDWIAATLCDGAGSAKKARQGAEYVSNLFSKKLLTLGQELEKNKPGAWINDKIIEYVIEVRSGLRELSKSDDISDYHTTLAALLLGPIGGISVHIGDGVIIAGVAKNTKEDRVWNTSDIYISHPENGEYSNETYFITESNWIKHIRIMPMPFVNWAVIGSDGGAEFIYSNRNKQPIKRALELLLNGIANADTNSIQPLSDSTAKLLTDEKFADLTADDKSLAIIKSDIINGKNNIVVNENMVDDVESTKRQDQSVISPVTAKLPQPVVAPKSSKKKKIILGLSALAISLIFVVSSAVYILAFKKNILQNLEKKTIENNEKDLSSGIVENKT